MNLSIDDIILIALVAATLLVVALLALVASAALRSGANGAAKQRGGARPMRLLGADSLRLSFRRAIQLIEKNLAARAERYNLSWTLLLNEGADDELPLRASGLRGALSDDASLGLAAQGIAWNFFDKGVVVQLRASHLGTPDGADADADDGVWDALLGLCRAYRPQRPFDSIVLAVPCTLLLQSGPEAQLALAARAKTIHRRLWLAQNRLAMRFPIHLIVTECEKVPGFASFGAALPESMRRSILGWASPYELVAPFRTQWVDAALDQIVGAVADGCAELCAVEAPDADSNAYFLLPTELERLRAGLKVFCEELMRPSAYHEAFLLRGIYLTGDADASAVLQAGVAGAVPTGVAPAVALAGSTETVMSSAMPQARAEAERGRMPVFLRDIFERKIFAEVGLVRSARQRMRRPAASRLAAVMVFALPAAWALGLVVATVQLHQASGVLLSYLQALGEAAHAAGPAAEAQSQRRAIAALDNFESLGGVRFYSVFMPGSWPLLDDLNEQLRSRIEQEFALDAVAALRAAALAQAGRLTGARDAVTGNFSDNGQCNLPARWNEQVAASPYAGLNLKDQPEHGALLGYVDRLDELDQALAALQRLAQTGKVPASGADLALAVRLLLKKELRGTPTRTAALFRAAAQDRPPLDIGPVQAAARCSLRLANGALYQHLFDHNALLQSERALDEGLARVREGAAQGADLRVQLAPWLVLRAALDDQQRLLGPGQGAWMRQRSLDLGPAYETMLKRIGDSRLLGPAAARDSRDLAQQGFGRFLIAWERSTGTGAPGADGSLAWTGAGWAFAPERKTLHDALTALLAQPYMKAGPPARLPDLPVGATIRWDRSQVEHALSLADTRKAFQSGTYLSLPAALQQPAARLVDLALAADARAALAQGLRVEPQALPSAASDAERAGVLRVRAWLDDIGARELVAELDLAVTRDALARLTRLDQVFDAAQVYVPRDASFASWQGQKGVMLDAFGGGDAPGLSAYLEQQQDFVDTIVQQSESVLNVLASSAQGQQALVTRWQALVDDQRRYRLKSPTSSRMALESFIATGSADIDAGNCAEKLNVRAAPRRAADPFAGRLQSLQGGLLARCRALVAGDEERQWQHFADAYNRSLGRRAPFVAAAAGAAPGANPGDMLPADRDTVGNVMKLYDRAHAAGGRAAVRKADLQLRRVHDLLAPLYPSEEGQVGGLDVAAEFRASPGAESGANQIIDWSLSIGAATVHAGAPARPLRWEPGMPVALSLRLARDGVLAPAPESGRSDMSVSDRTVTFHFDDPWALISFVNAYRDPDASGDDGHAPLLRFEFPLVRAGAGARTLSQPDARARVFLRLRVSAPGKHTPLAWPALFPAQVPGWEDPQQAAL